MKGPQFAPTQCVSFWLMWFPFTYGHVSRTLSLVIQQNVLLGTRLGRIKIVDYCKLLSTLINFVVLIIMNCKKRGILTPEN